MALRDKLAERSQPFLQPGEQLQQTFLAQSGLNPYIANMFGLIGMLLGVKRYIVAVTDQAVVLLSANFNGTKPTATPRGCPATPASDRPPVSGTRPC